MEPQLGIVYYRDTRSFVMADIPGIIEGASEGKGLGLRFLRHIERNAVLLFMVPADADDIRHEYEVLLDELRRFNPQLMDKPRVLAVSKCDMLDDELIDEIRREHLPDDIPTVFISAVSGMGLTELKDVLWRTINDENNINSVDIIHRPLDAHHRVREEDEFIFENAPAPEDDAANDPDMQHIAADSWGEDFDEDGDYYDEEYDDSYDTEFDSQTGEEGTADDEDDDVDPDIISPDDPDAFLYESSLDDNK